MLIKDSSFSVRFWCELSKPPKLTFWTDEYPEKSYWMFQHLSTTCFTFSGFALTALAVVIGFFQGQIASVSVSLLVTGLMVCTAFYLFAGEMAREAYKVWKLTFAETIYMFTSALLSGTLLLFVTIRLSGIDWSIFVVLILAMFVPIAYFLKRGVHNIRVIYQVWKARRKVGPTAPVPENPDTSVRKAERLKSEERRALVLLGITAIIVTILADMWLEVATKAKKFEDFYFNFPPYLNVPHLTTYEIPVLQTLVAFWVGYAFFAFWYFCVDWFPGKKGKQFREISHALATIFLGFYVVYFVWLIPVAYLALVWIPDPWKTLYFQLAFGLIVVLEWLLVDFAVGSNLVRRMVRFYSHLIESSFTHLRARLRK